ncbi:MAG: hypothetical protein V1859_04800 [archaeon]
MKRQLALLIIVFVVFSASVFSEKILSPSSDIAETPCGKLLCDKLNEYVLSPSSPCSKPVQYRDLQGEVAKGIEKKVRVPGLGDAQKAAEQISIAGCLQASDFKECCKCDATGHYVFYNYFDNSIGSCPTPSSTGGGTPGTPTTGTTNLDAANKGSVRCDATIVGSYMIFNEKKGDTYVTECLLCDSSTSGTGATIYKWTTKAKACDTIPDNEKNLIKADKICQDSLSNIFDKASYFRLDNDIKKTPSDPYTCYSCRKVYEEGNLLNKKTKFAWIKTLGSEEDDCICGDSIASTGEDRLSECLCKKIIPGKKDSLGEYPSAYIANLPIVTAYDENGKQVGDLIQDTTFLDFESIFNGKPLNDGAKLVYEGCTLIDKEVAGKCSGWWPFRTCGIIDASDIITVKTIADPAYIHVKGDFSQGFINPPELPKAAGIGNFGNVYSMFRLWSPCTDDTYYYRRIKLREHNTNIFGDDETELTKATADCTYERDWITQKKGGWGFLNVGANGGFGEHNFLMKFYRQNSENIIKKVSLPLGINILTLWVPEIIINMGIDIGNWGLENAKKLLEAPVRLKYTVEFTLKKQKKI